MKLGFGVSIVELRKLTGTPTPPPPPTPFYLFSDDAFTNQYFTNDATTNPYITQD